MVVLKNLSKLLFPASYFLLSNVGIELKNCSDLQKTFIPHECPDGCTKQTQHKEMMDKARIKARGYIEYFRKVNGVPGMSCAVLINGENGSKEHMIHFGYPDITETKEVDDNTLWDIRGIAGAFVSYIFMRANEDRKSLGNTEDKFDGIYDLLMKNLTYNKPNSNAPFPPDGEIEDLFNHYEGLNLTESAYDYSLENFHYLSNVLEMRVFPTKQEGKYSYKETLKEWLKSTGLGMKLYEEIKAENIIDIAKGYVYEDGFLKAVNKTFRQLAYGACGVLSTSLNLARTGKLFWENYKNQDRTLPNGTEPLKHAPVKKMFTDCSETKIHTIKDGRLRLGFKPCLAFKKVEDLQPYGMRAEGLENYFISSNVSGYSSILYIKGVDGNKNYIVVAITSNKEQVELYGLADRVATMYEQANKIYDKTSPFVEAAAQL